MKNKTLKLLDEKKLVKIITDYRTIHNISVRLFCEQAEISYSSYQQMSKGQWNITIRFLEKVANMIGMDFYDLVGQVIILSADQDKNELLYDTFKTLFLLEDEQLKTIHDEVKRMAFFK